MPFALVDALLALVIVMAWVTPSRAEGDQSGPLPDSEAFLAQTRAQLKTDRELQSHYTFHEREAEIHLSKLGKLTTGQVKVYEVYPGLEPDDTYRRLIEIDGKPRDPADLEKDDRKHREKILDELHRREHETAGEREKRLRREEERRRETEATLDDLVRVYTFTLVERQPLNGRSTIVFDFAPRPNAAPKTNDGTLMKKVKGRVWISEDDHQIARVEIEMLDDLSIHGFLGKLYKGTTASFERRKINDEVWLPAQARFNGSGRALVRKFHIDTVVDYSDYRKFSVQTDTEFALPKKPGGSR
jgi:hypothetical protein